MDTENVNNTIPRAGFKKIRMEGAVRRKKLKKIFWSSGGLILLIILVGGGIWYSSAKNRSLPGEFIADQGREHITARGDFVYNSSPPTSGPHFPRAAEWGTYKEEIDDETIIHNLEHGGIWVSYKPGMPEEIRKKLESFYEKWGRKVIVAPRSKNDSDIALAAWNHLDKFNVSEYSDERVEKFIKAFRNKGPEFVP